MELGREGQAGVLGGRGALQRMSILEFNLHAPKVSPKLTGKALCWTVLRLSLLSVQWVGKIGGDNVVSKSSTNSILMLISRPLLLDPAGPFNFSFSPPPSSPLSGENAGTRPKAEIWVNKQMNRPT